MSRSPPAPDGATGIGTITASACGDGASASPPSLHGTSSDASREPPRLHRPLPDPVAPGPVAGGGRVEADRPRHRPEQRRRRRRIDDRARRERGDRAHRRAARVDAPRRTRSPRTSAARAARATRATSTRAPARRSDAASSASASRNPAVPPSDTINTSTRGIRPGILAPHGSRRRSPRPSPSAVCTRPTGFRRGRSSSTRASSRSRARPTSSRSSAPRRPCRPTPRSRRTGARW